MAMQPWQKLALATGGIYVGGKVLGKLLDPRARVARAASDGSLWGMTSKQRADFTAKYPWATPFGIDGQPLFETMAPMTHEVLLAGEKVGTYFANKAKRQVQHIVDTIEDPTERDQALIRAALDIGSVTGYGGTLYQEALQLFSQELPRASAKYGAFDDQDADMKTFRSPSNYANAAGGGETADDTLHNREDDSDLNRNDSS